MLLQGRLLLLLLFKAGEDITLGNIHMSVGAGFSPDSIKGNGVQAYAPSYLGTKMEKWNFILCEPNLNQVCL